MRLVMGFLAVSALGADPTKVFTSAEIMKRLAASKPQAHQVYGSSLEAGHGFRLSANKREASGIPELHQKVDDIFVIESGEATLITGGTIVGPKTTAADEVRGQSIQGGTKRTISTGDFVHIPANTPHQFLVDEGKQITYAVVKVDVR